MPSHYGGLAFARQFEGWPIADDASEPAPRLRAATPAIHDYCHADDITACPQAGYCRGRPFRAMLALTTPALDAQRCATIPAA